MKSIEEIEQYADKIISNAQQVLPLESSYYYVAGVNTMLAFIQGESEE